MAGVILEYRNTISELRAETDPVVLAEAASSARAVARRAAAELVAGEGSALNARVRLAQRRMAAAVIAANPHTAPDVVADLVVPVTITHHDKRDHPDVVAAAAAVGEHWPADLIEALHALAARNLDVDWDLALTLAEGLIAPQR